MGYPYQSSVQNIDAVRFGSAKIEISATIGTTTATFTNLGIAKGVSFKEEVTRAWVGGDNAEPRPLVVKQRAVISGSLVEYDPKAWDIIRGGIDIYTSSTGDGGHKGVESGGLHTQAAFQVQLTNITVSSDPTTGDFRINAWKCFDNGGLEFAFQPDEDENPMEMPFEFTAVADSTRGTSEGLLFQIIDEQSTS